jgi:hypothetical protein
MELDLLNAVAGGEDDHSMLRYHIGVCGYHPHHDAHGMPVSNEIELNHACNDYLTFFFFAESALWKHSALDGRQDRAGAQFLC